MYNFVDNVAIHSLLVIGVHHLGVVNICQFLSHTII